ncbi:MAG: DUF1684 domain-containing protein [Saprospiraceae bacterium]|nr:DUF1684 domain-containing protein [Saprospiraceae bacterium]
MKRLLIYSILIIAFANCQRTNNAYKLSIEEWQQERLNNLVREDGWATLAGLFPLKDGEQYFGSSQSLTVRFPAFAPDTIGSFHVSNDSVWMTAPAEKGVMINGVTVTKILLVPASDLQVCTLGRSQWFVIQRGSRFLIRLRDTQHPARTALTHIPYYPIDENWKLTATFHPYETPKSLALPNALDMIINNESPGYLKFSYHGEEFQMLTLEEGDELFLLFYDQTSGVETYGGGRYLYADKPVAGETTVLDFNKAYSPPCAFTEFATCLLPPQENRYPFAITAGEKDPHFLH